MSFMDGLLRRVRKPPGAAGVAPPSTSTAPASGGAAPTNPIHIAPGAPRIDPIGKTPGIMALPQGTMPVLKMAPAGMPPGPNVDPVTPAPTLVGGTPAPAGAMPVLKATGTPAAAATGTPPSMQETVDQFARESMAHPTRFDSDLVKQGLAQINSDSAREQDQRMNQLSELMSRRGLLGSSVETDGARNLLSDIEATRSQRALDLGLEQARTYASDRQGAYGQGAGQETFGQNVKNSEQDDRMRELALLLQAMNSIPQATY